MLCYHKTLNSQSLKSQLSPFLSVKTFQVSRHSKFLFSYEYHAVRVFWQCIWGGKKYTNFHSFKTLWFCSSQSFLNTCITKRGVYFHAPPLKTNYLPSALPKLNHISATKFFHYFMYFSFFFLVNTKKSDNSQLQTIRSYRFLKDLAIKTGFKRDKFMCADMIDWKCGWDKLPKSLSYQSNIEYQRHEKT